MRTSLPHYAELEDVPMFKKVSASSKTFSNKKAAQCGLEKSA
jgi:hypothetical protein